MKVINEHKLGFGQNLFEALQNVCDFIALESDMTEIVNAVEKDNEDKFNNVALGDVIQWVATKDELPKVHTKVLLYSEDSKGYALEFIHEFDLTTDRYTRNWTHWAEFKPPCV